MCTWMSWRCAGLANKARSPDSGARSPHSVVFLWKLLKRGAPGPGVRTPGGVHAELMSGLRGPEFGMFEHVDDDML